MRATDPQRPSRSHNSQIYIKFYQKEILSHYKLPFSKFVRIAPERRLLLALNVLPTTAKVVSKAFKMPIESVCRRKRDLEIAGRLQTSRKRAICPFTGRRAYLLTADQVLFNSKYFGYE
jgi:hypothetical protein